MTQLTREQALAHFGVKGMRWGVRNEEDVAPVTKAEYDNLLKNQPKKIRLKLHNQLQKMKLILKLNLNPMKHRIKFLHQQKKVGDLLKNRWLLLLPGLLLLV